MSDDTATPPGASQAEINEAEWATRSNWKLGMFYASERDSRLWVPKKSVFGRKSRLGYTPNLGKRAGRIYVTVLGGAFLVIVAGLMLLRRMSGT